MSRKEGFEALLGQLNQDLGLNAEQSSQIRGIVEGHLAKRKSIRNQFADNKEARKAAMRPLNKELRKEIAGTLNGDQKVTFKANKATYKSMLKG